MGEDAETKGDFRGRPAGRQDNYVKLYTIKLITIHKCRTERGRSEGAAEAAPSSSGR